MYAAHSGNEVGEVQPLKDHLRAVADLAASFAEVFDAAQEARVTALLHDIGKYGERFQARLAGQETGVDHWTWGAVLALEKLQKNGVAAALAVQGHHIGLQQVTKTALREIFPQCWPDGRHPLNLRLSTDRGGEAVLERFHADGLRLPSLERSIYSGLAAPAAAAMLDVRMLYSTLVDADFLDTEAHFGGCRPASVALQPSEALQVLRAHLERLERQSSASSQMQRIRRDLLSACLHAAEQPPGLFTLTAPTGAGKTFSMLAFALRHAALHDLRRVVVVIPFLTIIEQTADAYRRALSELPVDLESYVLEDHSLADQGPGTDIEDDDADRRRLLAENWDAPIIVTTSVQFLESLFAHRPRRCRKLHRLARSVILFDEVQTLPTRLAVPTLATLSHLAGRYGATVVFATATQPAFSHLDECVRRYCAHGWQPREIAPAPAELFARSRRVRVRWPGDDAAPVSWQALAEKLVQERTALCVVNLKRHAWALLDELVRLGAPGLLHLSTSLCPAHRRRVVEEVRRRLGEGEPCLLVSTQCVEAGVDVDFPTVYRAWGPLDAIAQVAGRCNRNGRRSQGELRLFFPEDGQRLYPSPAYRQAADVAWTLARRRGTAAMDLDDPQVHLDFYRRLYDIQQLAHPSGRAGELLEFLSSQHFAEVARRYRLIDQAAVQVLVPYDQAAFESLAAEVRGRGLTRDWVRRARAHAVNIFPPRKDDAAWSVLESVRLARTGETAEDWFVLLEPAEYDPLKGLMPHEESEIHIA
jgi:CRISPR-associated endonuclease Cas3-HD